MSQLPQISADIAITHLSLRQLDRAANERLDPLPGPIGPVDLVSLVGPIGFPHNGALRRVHLPLWWRSI